MKRSNAFWIPLVGIGLVLLALLISPTGRTPLRIAACVVGLIVLAIRAALLYRKTRS